MNRALLLDRRIIVRTAVATTSAIFIALAAGPVDTEVCCNPYQLIAMNVPDAYDTSDTADFQETLKHLVNKVRKEQGVRSVSVDARLTKAAQLHSRDMAAMNSLTHFGSDGSTLGQRLSRSGFKRRSVGENVALNQTSPREVIEAWSSSPGHLENMINPRFAQVGFGFDDGYWTAVFTSSN
ncbi:CAP domain-containing protein [Streptomyces erythrochromogenes]|uniref:CAP domain-containing protein n=1 Tax=Streptomyces erythrochromogenes TaxID=285574 RepID=UPI00381CD9C9